MFSRFLNLVKGYEHPCRILRASNQEQPYSCIKFDYRPLPFHRDPFQDVVVHDLIDPEDQTCCIVDYYKNRLYIIETERQIRDILYLYTQSRSGRYNFYLADNDMVQSWETQYPKHLYTLTDTLY
jgi:hypothetical protein